MTYPTISHFIESVTGLFIPLPIQTFGFFIVLAFLIGHHFIRKEFLRLEKLNILNSIAVQNSRSINNIIFDYIINGSLSFLFGFKIIHIIQNYQHFSESPQAILLSKDGNIVLGCVFLLVNILFNYYTNNKRATKPIQNTHILPSDLSWNILFVAGFSGIIGAKLFAVMEDVDYLMTLKI